MIKKLMTIFVIFISINLFSCFTYTSNSRGSLSDQMERAKDKNRGNKDVPPNYDNDDNHEAWGSHNSNPWYNNDPSDSDIFDSENNNPNDIYIAPSTFDKGGFLLVRTGTSIINGPYFDSSASFEFLFGGSDENLTAYFYGGLELLHVNINNDVNESIHETPGILYGGIEFRYYPFNDFKVFTPYAVGRIGGLLMMWDYKNNLGSDGIGGLTLDLGLGIDIIHTKKMRLGIQCKPQSYLYGIQTFQGFTNDYFSPSGNIMISAEIGFNFL